MNLIFTLFLLSISYFGADLRGMENKSEDIKDIEFKTIDEVITIPKELLRFTNGKGLLAQLAVSEDAINLEEFSNQNEKLSFLNGPNIKNFIKIFTSLNKLSDIKIKGTLSDILEESFPKNNLFSLEGLGNFVLLCNYIALDDNLVKTMDEAIKKKLCRSSVDLEKLSDQSIIFPPKNPNNLLLHKSILMDKGESNPYFNLPSDEYIFIKDCGSLAINKLLPSGKEVERLIKPHNAKIVRFKVNDNNNGNNTVLCVTDDYKLLTYRLSTLELLNSINKAIKMKLNLAQQILVIKTTEAIEIYNAKDSKLRQTINNVAPSKFTISSDGSKIALLVKKEDEEYIELYELGEKNLFKKKEQRYDLVSNDKGKNSNTKLLFINNDTHIYIKKCNTEACLLDLFNGKVIPFNLQHRSVLYEPNQNVLGIIRKSNSTKRHSMKHDIYFFNADNFVNLVTNKDDLSFPKSSSTTRVPGNVKFLPGGDFLILKGTEAIFRVEAIPNFYWNTDWNEKEVKEQWKHFVTKSNKYSEN